MSRHIEVRVKSARGQSRTTLSGAPASQRRNSVQQSSQRSVRSIFLGSLGFIAVVSFLLVNVVDPYTGAVASPYYVPAKVATDSGQVLALNSEYTATAARDSFSAKAAVKAAAASAPAAGIPDPDTAQALGLAAVTARGWGSSEFDCLVALWNRESHWNAFAHNKSSGAYGIPQALPGEKMATVADDWQTNPATQIEWGLRYIQGRYGSPCGAWAHSEAHHWY